MDGTPAQAAPSNGTVAMNYAALEQASVKLVSSAGAIKGALGDLNTALSGVRETWYQSGAQSGVDAMVAEMRLRMSLEDMAQIINNIGMIIKQAGMDGATLDQRLGGRFQEFAPIRMTPGSH